MSSKEQDSSWVVQKYGGTSLGKLLGTITGTIVPNTLKNDNVVIVCSARSGTSKSKGTTSLLLEAISHVVTPGAASKERLDCIIDIIRDEHLVPVEPVSHDSNEEARDDSVRDSNRQISEDCEQLRTFLHAAQTVGELSPRSQDRVLAVGEKLACRNVASSLESKGIVAEVVLLDDIVEQAFPMPAHEQKETYDQIGSRFFDAIAQEIGKRILQCGDKVPVITGFFGMMPESLLHGVGRGYSDVCAAMCAVGIGARELQIWKEVDGIFTADPSKVPSARLLATVTSEEAAELTYYGSEVIHPLTMEQIRNVHVPLRLKNVNNPTGAGTIIYPSTTPSSSPYSIPRTPKSHSGTSTPLSTFMTANGYHGDTQHRRTPTAVTVKDSIIVINVLSHRNIKSYGFLAQIFERLDHHKIVVDLITTSEKSISLAVSSADDTLAIKRVTAEIEKLGTVSVTENMSIISVVGHKMRNMVGIAGEIFSTLATAKVNIYLISQGANEINISFVVRNRDAIHAMNVVHTQVLRIPAHAEKENNFIKGPWLY